jgi:F1F0 ATPase subunit 2
MIAFIMGIILGGVYFGGLYLSVQKINQVKRPGLLMSLSLVVRMVILIGAFFYLAKSGTRNILFALVGVILVRFVMIYLAKNHNAGFKERGD